MGRPKHTLIFDIGKTNKKLFVFDRNYHQVHKEYIRFETVMDDDGHPADDLATITAWIKDRFHTLIADENLNIEAVNFSTYGATLVHIDDQGKVLTPLYNYTKDYPRETLELFLEKYDRHGMIACQTASPLSGMLNAGLQLFWLANSKKSVYRRIRYSLHFPQYLSFMFTGIPVSEFTGIGCHTALWHIQEKDYHPWVYQERLNRVLAPIVPTSTSINMHVDRKNIRVGVGIHDSSASLLPYLRAEKRPFVLISTGTWSVSLNPYDEGLLSSADMQNDCLNYMRIDGTPVKASRLFLGNEYKVQVEALCDHFNLEYGYHRSVSFDEDIYMAELQRPSPVFKFTCLKGRKNEPAETEFSTFPNFETAFHRLMIELMRMQVESTKETIGDTEVDKVYVDGGFADNDIFIKLASHHFGDYKLRTTRSPLGSALGAAMVISDRKVKSKFLKKHYEMRKHESLILPS